MSPWGIEDLATANLSTKKGRIQHLVKMIKLYPVLRFVSEITSDGHQEGYVVKPRVPSLNFPSRSADCDIQIP